MNLIEKELFKRKIKKLPSEYLEDIMYLDEKEYKYLGEPAVIITDYLTYRCNCKDRGKLVPIKGNPYGDKRCIRCQGMEH